MNPNSSNLDRTGDPPKDAVGWGRLRDQSGIALLVALIVVVLMVTLVVEFDYGTRASLNTAATFRDGVQAMYLAKSGVAAARAVLVDDATTSPLFDSLTELWANPLPPYPVGNGTVSITIQDELSRLNVNLLEKPSTSPHWLPIFKRLFENLKIDPEVLYAIKDWIDDDDDETEFSGAESSFYQRLDPPYGIKNGPMDSFGELLLIKGVTPEVYNTLLIGCEGGPCITVAPIEKENRVNLNTISIPVCEALDESLNEELCQNLANGRPILNIESDLEAVPGWGGVGGTGGPRFRLKPIIGVKSNLFSIRSIAAVQDTQRIVEALVRRTGGNTEVITWRLR
jgi:general secretion pathway protein K